MNPPRSQSDADPNLVPFSGQASHDVIREGVSVLHLNVEGLTKAKTNVIEQLLQKHKATVVLLQETHIKDSSRLKIPGFTLAAHTASDIHGTATFVKNATVWKALVSCLESTGFMSIGLTCGVDGNLSGRGNHHKYLQATLIPSPG